MGSSERKATRRELLRRGGGIVALGALGGLAAWLIGRDGCAEPRSCAGCRHRATCARPPAVDHRRKGADHGG